MYAQQLHRLLGEPAMARCCTVNSVNPDNLNQTASLLQANSASVLPFLHLSDYSTNLINVIHHCSFKNCSVIDTYNLTNSLSMMHYAREFSLETKGLKWTR